jgi:hypothetical protein
MIVLFITTRTMQEVNRKRMSNVSESERIVDEYLARKSRFVPAREYERNGKVLLFNSAKVRLNQQGRFEPVIEYTVTEPGLNVERIVNASAITLITGLRARLREKPSGTDVPLLIKKTGVGTDTKYVVEHATSAN